MTYEEFFETEDVTINDVRDIVLEHMLEVGRQYWIDGFGFIKRNPFAMEICESDEFTLFLIEMYMKGYIALENLIKVIRNEIRFRPATVYGENMNETLKMLMYLKEKGVR